MKYLSEFRDKKPAMALAECLSDLAQQRASYQLMEFCGGHTHTISAFGLIDLLPSNVHLIHGPGCPVCVLPVGRIDAAIELALKPQVILATYADTLRIPASKGQTLLKAKALGADIRMVFSVEDALQMARKNPQHQVVFFAIGFETTTPPTAVAILTAKRESISNFSVFCNHVLTPVAMRAILDSSQRVPLDGFIGPAHVSTIIGSRPYETFATVYKKPVVIAGFEPLDVLLAIKMLITQINEGRAEVENEFTRAVSSEGNSKAQALVNDVFQLRPTFEWRGLQELADSALQIREKYQEFDAEFRFTVSHHTVPDHKACECAQILRGLKKPQQCRVFATACTPEHPLGACMVSSEGACAAYYLYGRHRS